jgi:hypothetical protein
LLNLENVSSGQNKIKWQIKWAIHWELHILFCSLARKGAERQPIGWCKALSD